MKLKRDTKFGKELTCFKIRIRNLTNFNLSTQVSKIFTLMGSFRAKYVLLELKKYRGVSFMTLKSDAKSEEKLTCCLANDMRNLADFQQSILKCQNWNFDGILLPKAENVLP